MTTATPEARTYNTEELRSIGTVMVQQIGRNAMACIGTRRKILSEVEGKARLTIKTSNCGSRNRYVEITPEHNDTYTAEGVNTQRSRRGGIYRKVKYTASEVYCDVLGGIVIEAADAKN